MKFALTLSLMLALVTAAAFAQAPAATTIEYYKTMDWISGTVAHSETFSVVHGQWVEIKLSCYTGQYLPDCGQPAYFVGQTEIKIPKLASWTMNGFTEQIFGMTANATGTMKAEVPVLQGNIEYKGAVLVSAGPQ